MNEVTEEVVKPNETEVTSDDWGFDFSEEAQVEETTEEPVKVEDPEEPQEEQDFSPLLEALSKDLKYMDEEVKISSIEEAKALLQKGKDYDRKNSKLEELKNDEGLQWLDTKAKENGMNRKEYLEAIKKAEQQQELVKEQEQLQDMLDNGISEEIAKEIIETKRARKEMEEEKAKLKEEQTKIEAVQKREAKYEEFVKAYPDINLKEIPKEVFIEAEQTSLHEAYARYENTKLKQELEIMKQNLKNQATSPVKGTTEHGKEEITRDPFLAMFQK